MRHEREGGKFFSPLVKGGLGGGGQRAISHGEIKAGVIPGYQLRNNQSECVKDDGLFTRALGEMCLIGH
jgi:hypothetical protein